LVLNMTRDKFPAVSNVSHDRFEEVF
jgi:hypothetical protein